MCFQRFDVDKKGRMRVCFAEIAAGMIAGALMLLLGVSEEAADTLFDWYIDDETRCLLVGGGLAVFNYFLMKLFSKDWENM